MQPLPCTWTTAGVDVAAGIPLAMFDADGPGGVTVVCTKPIRLGPAIVVVIGPTIVVPARPTPPGPMLTVWPPITTVEGVEPGPKVKVVPSIIATEELEPKGFISIPSGCS